MILVKTQQNHRQRLRDKANSRQDGTNETLAYPDTAQNQVEMDPQQKEDELAKVWLVFLIIFLVCVVPNILHMMASVVYWKCLGIGNHPLYYELQNLYNLGYAIYYSSVFVVCMSTHRVFRHALCGRL